MLNKEAPAGSRSLLRSTCSYLPPEGAASSVLGSEKR